MNADLPDQIDDMTPLIDPAKKRAIIDALRSVGFITQSISVEEYAYRGSDQILIKVRLGTIYGLEQFAQKLQERSVQ